MPAAGAHRGDSKGGETARGSPWAVRDLPQRWDLPHPGPGCPGAGCRGIGEGTGASLDDQSSTPTLSLPALMQQRGPPRRVLRAAGTVPEPAAGDAKAAHGRGERRLSLGSPEGSSRFPPSWLFSQRDFSSISCPFYWLQLSSSFQLRQVI